MIRAFANLIRIYGNIGFFVEELAKEAGLDCDQTRAALDELYRQEKVWKPFPKEERYSWLGDPPAPDFEEAKHE